MVKAIVGANWGDEGKGKITDMLAEQSDVVIRFQGGANAGHTIINDYGRFALHILPSGAFYPHITNIIGNGVALDAAKLVAELKSITDQGVPAPNLIVSERAQLLMPYHVLQDSYEEERLAGKAFGSTKSGIAPFYSDKYAKIGIQVCDLFHEDRLRERLTAAVTLKNVLFEHLYHKPALNVDELMDQLLALREQLRPYVGDVVTFIHEALAQNKTILLEGQLGSMKDPDLGIFPMTTSSHTLAGFGCVGAPVPPTAMEDVICVTKAYSSSVGSHTEPFVSEVLGDAGEELREPEKQTVGERVDVGDDPADDLAGRLRVDIRKRKYLELRERRLAHIADDVEGYAVVDRAHEPLEQSRRENYNAGPREYRHYSGEVDLSRLDYAVDRVADEYRHIKRQNDGRRREYDRQDDHEGIRLKVAENAFYITELCF